MSGQDADNLFYDDIFLRRDLLKFVKFNFSSIVIKSQSRKIVR